jgi:UDP-3-O-[3-hydroxymyristoyl] glucosamine N-acyltransferase
MKLGKLAELLGCSLLERSAGDAELEITGVAGMEHAAAGQITFLANPKYAHKVKNTQASAIIVSADAGEMPVAALISSNPYLDFARALECFYQPPRPVPGIHPTAVIAPSARLGENACVGPYAVIGENVRLGRNAVIHAHVVIYDGAEIGDDFLAHAHAIVREGCRLGHRVVLQNGVVVGGDGFGFAKRSDGSHYKIVQSGPVVVEDDVEIQTLSSVDRATVGETRIRRGAKIDSLVQIGHACEVGEDDILCAQVGLAGSTILKKNVLLAGQVGVAGHLTIGENAVAYAQSGIPSDVEANTVIAGYPAIAVGDWRRASLVFSRLPEMARTLRQLEKKMAAMEGTGSGKEKEQG